MNAPPPLAHDRQPLRAGFLLPLETIYAPRRAFATIAAGPEWIPAFALASLIGVIGVVFEAPALLHTFTNEFAALRGLAQGQALEAAARSVTGVFIDQLAEPPISWAFTALVFALVAPATGMRPARAFAVYFALAANVGFIDALSTFVAGGVIGLHDPKTYQSISDVILAVPDSLATFRPDGSRQEIISLGYWDVFALWTQILLGYGLAAISGRKLLPSLGLSFGAGLVLWYVYVFLS